MPVLVKRWMGLSFFNLILPSAISWLAPTSMIGIILMQPGIRVTMRTYIKTSAFLPHHEHEASVVFTHSQSEPPFPQTVQNVTENKFIISPSYVK